MHYKQCAISRYRLGPPPSGWTEWCSGQLAEYNSAYLKHQRADRVGWEECWPASFSEVELGLAGVSHSRVVISISLGWSRAGPH